MIKSNRLKSLIWLRWQYLISNKALLYICVLMPFGSFAIIQFIPKAHGNVFILSLMLTFVYSLTTGSAISMMIGEEKEKKNLRTLILSGVKQHEYVLSVITFSILFSVIACLSFPLLLRVNIPSWSTYLIIAISTCLIFILANLSIGLLSKTQSQASLLSTTLYIISNFLPIIYDISGNKLIKQILNWSFIGANSEYFIKLEHFKLTDTSIFAMLLWIIGLIILTKFAFRWNRKEHD